MEDEKTVLKLVASDMGDFTVQDVVCTNCIEGFCPARTPSVLGDESFTLCGAKKNSDEVLDAYRSRTGHMIVIERPC